MDKVYYSISEVSELTQLPSSTLRYWEEQFAQLKPRKNDKGRRFYTDRDVELIKRIKYIRDDLKITRISAIKKELLRNVKKVDSRQKAAEFLLKVREQLVELRKNI
jgi:DNA-binding transcriptional MerR regulator